MTRLTSHVDEHWSMNFDVWLGSRWQTRVINLWSHKFQETWGNMGEWTDFNRYKPSGFSNERSSGSTTTETYRQERQIVFGNGLTVNFELENDVSLVFRVSILCDMWLAFSCTSESTLSLHSVNTFYTSNALRRFSLTLHRSITICCDWSYARFLVLWYFRVAWLLNSSSDGAAGQILESDERCDYLPLTLTMKVYIGRDWNVP